MFALVFSLLPCIRHHINKKATGNVLPKPTQLAELKRKITQYLNKMTEELSAVTKSEHYQICCCLVASLIFRNSSRSGLKLYMVELAPEAILNVNGGQGERKRLADLESDKNFQYS